MTARSRVSTKPNWCGNSATGRIWKRQFGAPDHSQADPNLKIVRDPALARALDLLKGLAVVNKGHPG